MEAMKLQIGNTTVEIHDDYVNPKKTEQILKRIGMIRVKEGAGQVPVPEERKVS